MTVVGVKKEITQMKEQLLETVERSLMEKVDGRNKWAKRHNREYQEWSHKDEKSANRNEE